MGHLARSTPIVAAPNMMQQPAPPPPYSAHKQTPIGWAINDMPNGPPVPGNKKNNPTHSFEKTINEFIDPTLSIHYYSLYIFSPTFYFPR
jgi:hypothetical protein